MDILRAMDAFVAVCDHGGFSAAARATGQSKPVISKLVSGLEGHLDCRLLHRTTRTVSLTEEGAGYLDRARAVLEEISAVEAELAHNVAQPRGHLRVNAPLSFGQRYLAPIIARFQQEYEDITIELSLTDRFVNLVEEGFDLALRIGGDPTSPLIRRRLGSVRHGIFASPGYMKGRAVPDTVGDLKSHRCLVYGQTGWSRPWQIADLKVTPKPVLLSNNGDILRRAAVDGGGIVSLPEFFVAEDLEAGWLQCLGVEPEAAAAPLMVVYPVRRHLPLKVRAFIAFLAGNLEGTDISLPRHPPG